MARRPVSASRGGGDGEKVSASQREGAARRQLCSQTTVAWAESFQADKLAQREHAGRLPCLVASCGVALVGEQLSDRSEGLIVRCGPAHASTGGVDFCPRRLKRGALRRQRCASLSVPNVARGARGPARTPRNHLSGSCRRAMAGVAFRLLSGASQRSPSSRPSRPTPFRPTRLAPATSPGCVAARM